MVPWQNYFGDKVGSFITLLKFTASCAWAILQILLQNSCTSSSGGIFLTEIDDLLISL